MKKKKKSKLFRVCSCANCFRQNLRNKSEVKNKGIPKIICFKDNLVMLNLLIIRII